MISNTLLGTTKIYTKSRTTQRRYDYTRALAYILMVTSPQIVLNPFKLDFSPLSGSKISSWQDGFVFTPNTFYRSDTTFVCNRISAPYTYCAVIETNSNQTNPYAAICGVTQQYGSFYWEAYANWNNDRALRLGVGEAGNTIVFTPAVPLTQQVTRKLLWWNIRQTQFDGWINLNFIGTVSYTFFGIMDTNTRCAFGGQINHLNNTTQHASSGKILFSSLWTRALSNFEQNSLRVLLTRHFGCF